MGGACASKASPPNNLASRKSTTCGSGTTVVTAGDEVTVLVNKVGKEPGQGVGYLDDGTMVVVDNARQYLGRNIAL